MQAVSLSIVQAARTAPYRALFAVLCPYDAAIGCTAFRAEQQSAERVLAAEFAASGGSTFPCASILCTAPRNFKLHSIEHLAADDSFMVVLNEDLGKLPCIQYCFFADTILDEGFLKQGVPAVFFIGEDGAQVAGGPFRRPGSIADTAGLQRLADVLYAFSGKVAFKNPTNRLCFFRNDLRITIHPFLIAQHGFILKGDLAVLDGLTLAPADIGRDGFTLGLSEGGVERNEELTFRINGVDVLFLEDHGNAETSQLTGMVDDLPEYTITELPEGYAEDRDQRIEFGTQTYISYQNGDIDSAITLHYCYMQQGAATVFVLENADSVPIIVNGCEGQIFLSKNLETTRNAVTWIDIEQNIQFTIQARLSTDDLLHMAESVSLDNLPEIE